MEDDGGGEAIGSAGGVGSYDAVQALKCIMPFLTSHEDARFHAISGRGKER